MADPNIHVRAAKAHLARAAAPTFLDDTLRGLLAEIDRLNQWADGMADAALKERATAEAYQRELAGELVRLRAALTPKPIRTLPEEWQSLDGEVLIYNPCDGYHVHWLDGPLPWDELVESDIFTHWILVPKPTPEDAP